ncbi:MAG TPA: radical SAM protein [Chloroflexota bacterium]
MSEVTVAKVVRFSVREIQCKSAINRVRGMPFQFSINPYRGCRHACVYCYARPTHEYLGLGSGNDFQEVIFAKVNAPDVVRRELGRRSWRGDLVVIGTATDPYQQAESRYRLTRGILEAFRDFRNPVSITTKSPMVLCDLDVLEELARDVQVTVHFTVTTLDETLWRKLEPTTSRPRKRLEAVRALRERGIHAGIFLAPILPGLTDSAEHLETVVAAAAEHGAAFVWPGVLRLGPGISEYYLPFVEREFPELRALYRQLYRGNYAGSEYTRMVTRRVDALKERHGFVEQLMPAAKQAMSAVPMQPNLFA